SSKWLFYHPNGRLDCEGIFVDNKPSGDWKFWNLDGKLLMEVDYREDGPRWLNAWNPEGEQTLRNGNGIYITEVYAPDGKTMNRLEGPCVDGYYSGTWQIKNPQGQVVLEQNYGPKGEFLSGAFYENGKLVRKYKANDKKSLGSMLGM